MDKFESQNYENTNFADNSGSNPEYQALQSETKYKRDSDVSPYTTVSNGNYEELQKRKTNRESVTNKEYTAISFGNTGAPNSVEDESNKDIYEDTTVQPNQRNKGVYDNTFVEPTSKGQNDSDGSLYYNSPNVLPAKRLPAPKPVRAEQIKLEEIAGGSGERTTYVQIEDVSYSASPDQVTSEDAYGDIPDSFFTHKGAQKPGIKPMTNDNNQPKQVGTKLSPGRKTIRKRIIIVVTASVIVFLAVAVIALVVIFTTNKDGDPMSSLGEVTNTPLVEFTSPSITTERSDSSEVTADFQTSVLIAVTMHHTIVTSEIVTIPKHNMETTTTTPMKSTSTTPMTIKVTTPMETTVTTPMETTVTTIMETTGTTPMETTVTTIMETTGTTPIETTVTSLMETTVTTPMDLL